MVVEMIVESIKEGEEAEAKVETAEANEIEAEVEEERAHIGVRNSMTIGCILLLSLATPRVIKRGHYPLHRWLSHVRLDRCLRSINHSNNKHFLPCTPMLMKIGIFECITMCSHRLNSNYINMVTRNSLINQNRPICKP